MPNTQKWMMRIFALFVFLTLLTPFVVYKDLLFPFVTSKAFTLRIMVELAFPFYVFLVLSDKRLRPRLREPLNIAVLAFLAVNLVSALAGVNVTRSLWGNFERMGGVFYLGHLVALYFYMQLLGQAPGNWIKRFLQWLIAAAVLVTLNGISGKIGGPILVQDPSLPGRVSSTFGNPIFFPSFLIPVMFLSLYFAFQETVSWKRWAYGAAAVIQLYGVYISVTRGALVGLIAGIGIAAVAYIILTDRKAVKLYGGAAAAVLIIGVGLLFSFAGKLPEGSLPRRLFTLEDSNSSARLIQWRTALKGFPERPALGVGPENYYVIANQYFNPEMYKYDPSWFDKPHNYLLEILVTNGALGFAAYAGMIGFAIWGLYRSYKLELLSLNEATMLFCGLVAYEIQNLFVFDTVSASLSFYVLMGVIAYMIWEGRRDPQAEKEGRRRQAAGAGSSLGWASFGVAGIVMIYLVYVANVLPMRIAKDVNYGYAYSGADLEKSVSYFTDAINAPFNMDPAEVGGRYADFAARLPQNPLAQKDPQLAAQQIKTALDYERGVAEKLGNDPLAWNRVAVLDISQALLTQEPFDAAEADLQKALDLVPQRVEILQTMLQLRVSQQNFAEAANVAERMTSINPYNPVYAWQLATVYNLASQTPQAVDLGNKLLEEGKKPADYKLFQWLISYDQEHGNYSQAAELSELAVQLSPQDINAYMQLAQAYASSGQKQQAIDAANKVAELDPDKAAEVQAFIQGLR